MLNEIQFSDFGYTELPDGLECMGLFDTSGFAKAKKDGFWGYVDRDLNWVVNPVYDKVMGSYVGDQTIVMKYGRWILKGKDLPDSSETANAVRQPVLHHSAFDTPSTLLRAAA